jgi:Tfp pilus assembly protein PilN
VSLLDFKLKQKEVKTAPAATKPAGQYQSASAAAAGTDSSNVNQEETHIELEGIAPSDIEVALYIKNLEQSVLLDNVELVESKEYMIDEISFREFKLRTIIKREVMLTKEDIEKIRAKHEELM